jgi:hypothetical protein
MMYCVSWCSSFLCSDFYSGLYFVDGILVTRAVVANVCERRCFLHILRQCKSVIPVEYRSFPL